VVCAVTTRGVEGEPAVSTIQGSSPETSKTLSSLTSGARNLGSLNASGEKPPIVTISPQTERTARKDASRMYLPRAFPPRGVQDPGKKTNYLMKMSGIHRIKLLADFDWSKIFDSTTASAILDRLSLNGRFIIFEGRSYRSKK
jgi:hypothetical protein